LKDAGCGRGEDCLHCHLCPASAGATAAVQAKPARPLSGPGALALSRKEVGRQQRSAPRPAQLSQLCAGTTADQFGVVDDVAGAAFQGLCADPLQSRSCRRLHRSGAIVADTLQQAPLPGRLPSN